MNLKTTFLSFVLLSILIVCASGCGSAGENVTPDVTAPPPTPTLSPLDAAQNLHWFGYYSSILYHGSQNIYFDPVVLKGELPSADLILITHAHDEGWSLEDIKKIITPNTTLIISPNVALFYEQYKDELGVPAIILAEGESAEVNGVKIEATKVIENPNHLSATGIVGFLVTIDGIRIYDAAETVYYPEMANYPADITIYSVFMELGEDEIEQAVHGLQTKVMLFVRLPLSLSQMYVDRYNQQDLPIQFVFPSTGSYTP